MGSLCLTTGTNIAENAKVLTFWANAQFSSGVKLILFHYLGEYFENKFDIISYIQFNNTSL
jgi:hypothetical protein